MWPMAGYTATCECSLLLWYLRFSYSLNNLVKWLGTVGYRYRLFCSSSDLVWSRYVSVNFQDKRVRKKYDKTLSEISSS